ncbi:unnamed protein product [Darwinula stevensoni]|uniref:Uncharacterized protein n=1 Tax=Darwinula stevensoni TaxID=69355 RepID=A0A7R9A8I4_9CRUS|nr:unnamed protein product [Darwinula stevensoni]CAG0896478.1 unnamed protein product [Darwinula stevensoni]
MMGNKIVRQNMEKTYRIHFEGQEKMLRISEKASLREEVKRAFNIPKEKEIHLQVKDRSEADEKTMICGPGELPDGPAELLVITVAYKSHFSQSASLPAPPIQRETDYGTALRHLRDDFKMGNTLVDMDKFLDELSKKDLITMAEEKELKKVKEYRKKIDETFFILLNKNPQPTYRSVLCILEEMGREDLKEKHQTKLKRTIGKDDEFKDVPSRIESAQAAEMVPAEYPEKEGSKNAQ